MYVYIERGGVLLALHSCTCHINTTALWKALHITHYSCSFVIKDELALNTKMALPILARRLSSLFLLCHVLSKALSGSKENHQLWFSVRGGIVESKLKFCRVGDQRHRGPIGTRDEWSHWGLLISLKMCTSVAKCEHHTNLGAGRTINLAKVSTRLCQPTSWMFNKKERGQAPGDHNRNNYILHTITQVHALGGRINLRQMDGTLSSRSAECGAGSGGVSMGRPCQVWYLEMRAGWCARALGELLSGTGADTASPWAQTSLCPIRGQGTALRDGTWLWWHQRSKVIEIIVI